MAQRALAFVDRIGSGEDMFDRDIRDLDLHVTTQGLRLYASSGVNGGVAVYAVSSQGANLLDLEDHASGATLRSGQATVLEENGCLVQSGARSGVSEHDISTSGTLSGAQGLRLPGQEEVIVHLAAARLGDGRDVLVTLDTTGALRSWHVEGGQAAAAPQASFTHVAGQALAIADNGILLVADADLGGVASYRVTNSGQLRALSEIGIAQGLPVETPTALEVVTGFGQSWAILAAGGSDSLTVLSVGPEGQMQMIDHLSDTLETRFGAVTALEVVEAAGRIFVLAGGGDGGLSLLELLPDGRLLHRTAFETGLGQNLESVNAIAATQIGETLEVYVSSQDGAGLAHLTYDLSGFAAPGQQGTAGHDLLSGAATLSGGAGEDVLVAEAGGAVLTGGAGADVFVPVEQRDPDQTLIRITDFTPGQDSIDLSALTGLRSLADLTTQSRSGGLEVSYDGHRVIIDSASGQTLGVADIWPQGLGTPHRWMAGETVDDGILYGGSAADELSGGAGDETLDGQGGNDRIEAAGGDDILRGGDGRDSLFGGLGHDRLEGDRDADLLRAGAGNDSAYGGLGADRLYGEDGADRLYGDEGDDVLRGGSGNDSLYGGLGDDDVRGQGGNDLLLDLRGHNTLVGGGGQDVLKSGVGHDRLKGGAGDDRLIARGGDDRLLGGGGKDALKSNAGADTLKGGGGSDVLKAGSGADRLEGGKGDDRLVGGGGADVFVFARGHGRDKITDFAPGSDLLDLSGARVSYDDLEISRAGKATVIDTGSGEIWLSGLRPGEIDLDDFIF
ncbi:hypothetical protein HGD90_01525 [Rhodobacteraceae bacterium R_SAG7]|nr:hypothetical protein [Rhodobacteraceae bacterium R_SAG7]